MTKEEADELFKSASDLHKYILGNPEDETDLVSLSQRAALAWGYSSELVIGDIVPISGILLTVHCKVLAKELFKLASYYSNLPLCDQPSALTSAEVGDMILQYERIILYLHDWLGVFITTSDYTMENTKDNEQLARILKGREDEKL